MILKFEHHQFWWDIIKYKYINMNKVMEIRITPKRIRFIYSIWTESHVGATKYNLEQIAKLFKLYDITPEW